MKNSIYKFMGTTSLAAFVSVVVASAQATNITFIDAGFENAGDNPSLIDGDNYESWGNKTTAIIDGLDGKWFVRSFLNNLSNGPLLLKENSYGTGQNITGITDDQYVAYASGSARAMFQYNSVENYKFNGDFLLKVDVGATGAAKYKLGVVGFNHTSDLLVNLVSENPFSVGDNPSSGHDIHTSQLTDISGGIFETITLSGTLAGNYDYIGVLLLAKSGSNDNPADMVGFDNVRLNMVIPEPSTYTLLVGCLVLTAVMVRRRVS